MAFFVGALFAIVVPFYGIILVDYYFVKHQRLDIQEMFSTDPDGAYRQVKGWKRRAIDALALAALFSISLVWLPTLGALGGLIYYLLVRGLVTTTQGVRLVE